MKRNTIALSVATVSVATFVIPNSAVSGEIAELKQDGKGEAVTAQVEIQGTISENEIRRDSIAGKIVITRKMIEDNSASTAYELLRRHPAITVGSNGQIGLMGMAGYTQVLIDGAPAPASKNPLDLDVVHIERIEIVRSAIAEFGPFGSAGTINIISKKINRRTFNQLRTGINGGAQEQGASLAFSTNISDDISSFSYSAQISASKIQKKTRERSNLFQRDEFDYAEIIQQSAAGRENDTRRMLAAGTVNWKFDRRNKISFDPSVLVIQVDSGSAISNIWTPVDAGPNSSTQFVRSPFHSVSTPVKWDLLLDDRSQLTLSLSPTRFKYRKNLVREDIFSVQPIQTHGNLEHADRSADFAKANYTHRTGTHTVKVGLTVSRNTETASYNYTINGAPDLSLSNFGQSKDVADNKAVLFVQDEWRVSQSLSANLGLSSARRSMKTSEGIFDSRVLYSVWSPSLNVTWRKNEDAKDQIRIGLAKTFNEPFSDQLSSRPDINPLSPCSLNRYCGANSAAFADTVGNPNLRPEQAVGLNLSFEHYLAADSMVTLEFFTRQFSDTVGKHLQLMSVAWADQPRYVIRPENLGSAWSRGVGIEMQLLASDIWRVLPNVELRGAANYAVSRISIIPGPDNRIAGQSPWTAKLGAGYRLASLPLKISMDMSLQPASWIQSGELNRDYKNRRFDLGLDAAWTLDAKTKLKFNADHLISTDTDTVDQFHSANEVISQRATSSRVSPVFGIKIERKF